MEEQKQEEKKEETKEAHTGKKYFDNELKVTLKFGILGALIGYVSFLINNPPIAFAVMVVIGGLARLVVMKVLKIKEDLKWWISTAFVVYIIMWLVIWTIFYNVGLR